MSLQISRSSFSTCINSISPASFATLHTNKLQEVLAVASIARDDPSTLLGDAPFPRAHPHALRPQCVVNWDRKLKPKLAIMRQCTSVTDRQTDTEIVA